MKVKILGCGSSAGVPIVGCRCGVCTSSNPKNKRSRVSVYVSHRDTNVLIDASPDLRQQCLRHGIRQADAIVITHNHTDHTGGLDDARVFNFAKNCSIPIYTDRATMDGLYRRFDYAFQPMAYTSGWYKPHFYPKILERDTKQFSIGNIGFKPFWQGHGDIDTIGFRIGDFAYSPDANRISDEAFEVIKGARIWLVDCLRIKPAPTHAHLELTLSWIERVKPELAIITHMNHEMDYEVLLKELPKGVIPAYDGMEFEV